VNGLNHRWVQILNRLLGGMELDGGNQPLEACLGEGTAVSFTQFYVYILLMLMFENSAQICPTDSKSACT
jgi:hypothetical protein